MKQRRLYISMYVVVQDVNCILGDHQILSCTSASKGEQREDLSKYDLSHCWH